MYVIDHKCLCIQSTMAKNTSNNLYPIYVFILNISSCKFLMLTTHYK